MLRNLRRASQAGFLWLFLWLLTETTFRGSFATRVVRPFAYRGRSKASCWLTHSWR